MFNLPTLHPEAFGLDLSDLSLKIVKLKKRGKFFSLISFGNFSIKPGIIQKGEIKDPGALIDILKDAISNIKGEKLKTKYVVASLPEEKAFLEVIPMPIMEKEELEGAVKYEAENYIPLPIEEVYLDFHVVPPLYNHLDHQDILIAALPKTAVDSYMELFQKTGLKPVALEIESQATARALVKNQVSSLPLLIIDFGATRTSFIIFSGYSLRFTSSIPVCGRILTTAITRNLGISSEEAERVKIRYGLQGKKEIVIQDGRSRRIQKGKIFEILTPPLTDLIEQIKKCLSYYQAYVSHEHLPPNGKSLQKILVCGGGANMKGVCEFFSRELKMPVEIANPWVNILPEPLKEVPEISLEESLKYATALGLALRGVKPQ